MPEGCSCLEHICELGRDRLRLQGDSPGAVLDGCGLLLDGAIYRATELAAELDAPPLEDERLLLHAYRRWGTDFPRRVEGEFAFVLWDRAAARLVLGTSRGSPGLPIFCCHREGSFFFARGLRQLLRLVGNTPRLNEEYLANWLALTWPGSTDTMFKDVRGMIPGSVLVFEQGRIVCRDYWRPENTPTLRLRDPREYADGLLAELQRATGDVLSHHGAVASMLSGGLDSSTVTALAAEILDRENRRLAAFTAVPERPVGDVGNRFGDEGPPAAEVAALWPNIDHVLVRHGRHSLFSLLDRFSAEQLEPVINPANYDWAYEIHLQAGERGLHALLAGDSGNLTSSYNGTFALRALASSGRWFTLASLARAIHRQGSRSWLAMFNEALAAWIPLRLRSAMNVARRSNGLFEYSLIHPEFARRHHLGLTSIEQSMQRLDVNGARCRFLRRPDVGAVGDAFQRLTGVRKVDPTGDRRVVDFCLGVPIEHFCEDGVPRSLIRRAMAGRLPDAVRCQRRRGLQAADFPVHFERERTEALAELSRMQRSELACRSLDLQRVEQMIRCSPEEVEALGGMMDYWPRLLRAFSAGRFLRRLEDGTLLEPAPPAWQTEESLWSNAAG